MPVDNSPQAKVISRPKRWDTAFDAGMLPEDVERLLRVEPFRSLAGDNFPASVPLADILRYETRLRQFHEGDVILRQGDYGGSAFLLLAGTVYLCHDLPGKLLGQREGRRKSLLGVLRQLWERPALPEVRDVSLYSASQDRAYRTDQPHSRIDKLAEVLRRHPGEALPAGTLFGEVAALSRTPHPATLVAGGYCELLEIKWQGLRELMKHSSRFHELIDTLYRERSLRFQLLSFSLLDDLGDGQLDQLAAQTRFESLGQFDWHVDYKKRAAGDGQASAEPGPQIVAEGSLVDELILLRSGFARISRGGQTTGYLRAGEVFGLDAIAGGAALHDRALHALGYADILRIPASLIREHALGTPAAQRALKQAGSGTDLSALDPGLRDFLMEGRFTNGSQAMLINLDRCTGCDDCVSACATAHDNNPRFIRHGATHDKLMIANACMHCHDPVCLIGCPTGAIHRASGAGQVIINDQTCIGCMTCANSCPYNNIRMVNVRDANGDLLLDEQFKPIVKATKCDLCIDQWVSPSCQRACPHDALRRVDIHDIDTIRGWLA